MSENNEEEEKKIRHTITAEETFTLAKDVFDIRTFIKNVYSNRAVIARRVHIVTLCVSGLFTLLYTTFLIISTLYGRLSLGREIVAYCLLGFYAFFLALVLIFALLSTKTSAKNIKKITLAMKIFRMIMQLISVAISIAAITFATSSNSTPHNFALSVIVIVFSIISLIIQIIPLMFGGCAKFVRWLLSPVKIKIKFAPVVLEWYELAISGKPPKGSVKKISKKHYESISAVIDDVLIPELGGKYIKNIKPVTLLNIVENYEGENRDVLEGVLKSVFAYAADCGYVVFDPCRDLNFTGTVEEQKRKTMKERLVNVAVNFGKKKLDKFIAASSEEEDD